MIYRVQKKVSSISKQCLIKSVGLVFNHTLITTMDGYSLTVSSGETDVSD